ncbi:MAG: S1 RNA-binding domain-containing protein, partial [Gammaproteobacteria bacterium]|nr:S1 RNA-binding domain-containing protein [Gammaproteobacteria bacterium]
MIESTTENIESFAQLFEESLNQNKIRPGVIMSGTVVEIRPDTVVVNAGLKSEGVIPIEEFYNDDHELEVVVGEEVDVQLESLEDGYGATRLSREKAKRARVWTFLEKAQEADEVV